VKEFRKSVNVWWSYGKSLVSCFFDSQYIYIYIYIAPKSKIKSRAHNASKPARGSEKEWKQWRGVEDDGENQLTDMERIYVTVTVCTVCRHRGEILFYSRFDFGGFSTDWVGIVEVIWRNVCACSSDLGIWEASSRLPVTLPPTSPSNAPILLPAQPFAYALLVIARCLSV